MSDLTKPNQNGRAAAAQPTSQAISAAALPAGMTARRDAQGGQTLTAQAETAAEFLTAQARAMVEARYARALARPRDFDEVRVRLLKLCERWGFADEALYNKPVFGGDDEDEGKGRDGEAKKRNGGIEGLSIRFVEAALREMGNVSVDALTVYDDQRRRIVKVSVEDLETGAAWAADLTVEKTVERKKVPQGAVVLGTRLNHKGSMLHIVPATDDQILNKANAIVSKTVRTLGLRLIPPDIKGECEQRIRETLAAEVRKDPTAAKRLVIDSFAELNVMPGQLHEYLGHPVDQAVEKELVMLRALYQAIKAGEATWAEALDARREAMEAAAAAKRETQVRADVAPAPAAPAEADVPISGPVPPAAPAAPEKPTTTSGLAAKLAAEGKKAPRSKRSWTPPAKEEPAEAREPGADDVEPEDTK